MKELRLSNFLKLPIKPFIYGALLSRTMEENIGDKKYFYTYTNFRSSKYVYKDDFPINSYAKELITSLNKQSGHYNWHLINSSETQLEARFYLINDIKISKTMFYRAIYQKLLQENWILSDTINNEKKDFIRGFMELRGSVDTTRKLITQDYFYDNRIELKKAQILTDIMNLPLVYANFNARDLQPQFVSGENKRNTQFRINAFFYVNEIGFLNRYKAEIFKNAYKKYIKNCYEKDNVIYFEVDMPTSKNDDIQFIKYLNFFTNNIYEKNLTKTAISELRKRLGFNSMDSNNPIKRNKTIIDLFDKISEDKCAVCDTTQTFLNKGTGKQYFEIHHVISFYNGKEFDNIANLVKLCPTCHNMLKKNRSSKEQQIKAIYKILHSHPEIYEFTSLYLQINDINELADKIWSMLG